MGWQDRDWAKWTDDERSRFFGGGPVVVPGAFLAVVVSLLGLVAFSRPGGVSIFHLDRARPAQRAILYGVAVPPPFASPEPVVCTAVALDGVRCASWTRVDGRRVVAPITPVPRSCRNAAIDQRSGRWVCTSSA